MPKAQKRAIAIAANHVGSIGYRAEVGYRTLIFFPALTERLNNCFITQHCTYPHNKRTSAVIGMQCAGGGNREENRPFRPIHPAGGEASGESSDRCV